MIIIGIMSIASIWTGWFFTVDDANHYHRGELNIVQVSLIFAYLLYSFFVAVFTIKKKRVLVNKNKLYAISALGFLPFFANIVQIQYPGLSVFCVGATLGLVVVFLEIQREMISLDPLTRLNNRNQASIYLSTRFKQEVPGKKLYQFAMDLDKFKGINDTYGHMEGDKALLIVSNVLKVVCGPRGHFISRYGGDEFVVFANLPDDAAADELCAAIEEKLAKKSFGLPYELKMSIGYARLRKGETEESFGRRADEALYEIKNRKKVERV
jgi:diguanylate cyclase (GGDEF)-like protein